jgi:pimeloyl-ACP methyl ester carboxylesterase
MASWLMRAFGILLMLSALTLALTQAPDRPVETLVARWALPPSSFLEVKGQFVHVRDVGPRADPLPILLIHGISSSLHTWDGWLQVLQRHRRVISFDLPGFGLTGPRADGIYSPDSDARFVLDLLDALQVQHCVIGGNSLGGDVAWRTAALAPDRVDRLVLVDATGLPFELQSVPLGWQLARLRVLSLLTESVLPRPLVVQGLTLAYADPGKIGTDVVDQYYELALREGNRRALGERLRQWQMAAGAEQVATLKLPTLILWGAKDRLVPLAVGRDFQRRISGSTLVVFDQLGHLPQEEDPDASLVPLKAFLGLP